MLFSPKKIFVSILAATPILSSLPGQESPANSPLALPADSLFFRQAELTVPLAPPVFRIDGVISAEEREESATLTSFLSYEAAARGDNRVTVHAAHSEEGLYIGFTIDRHTGEPPRTTAPGNDSSHLWSIDDAFEMRLFPEPGSDGYSLVGNAAGMAGDGLYLRTPPSTRTPWNREGWEYAAGMTETGWQGEFLIQPSFFGLEGFTPGATWLADFFNNSRTDGRQSGWSYLAGLWKYELDRLNRLTFGGEGIPYQAGQIAGRLNTKRAGLSTRIANPSDDPRRVQAWAAFFRAADENPAAYWEQMKGVLDPRGIAIRPGATYAGLVDFAVEGILADYIPAEVIDGTGAIPRRGEKTLTLGKPDLPGNYLVAWRFADEKTGQVISSGVYPFGISPPLKAELEYHYLVGRTVKARTRITPEIAAQADSLRFTVLRDGVEMATGMAEDPAVGEDVEVIFPTADWSPGDYLLKVESLREDRVTATGKTPFRKPEAPFWWGTDAGKLIEVSWPWTPVEADGRTTSVWGRTLQWGVPPLPARIVSQETELLAAPPSLILEVDGQPAEFVWDTWETEAQKPDAVVYRGAGRAGNLRLETRTTVEFDGMTRFDWTFSAEGGEPPVIDKLFLEIPVKRNVAEMVASFSEKVEKSGPITDQPVVLGFTPSVVLRNSRVGLEWFAENQKGWSNEDEERLMEILPAEDEVVLRLRLVDKPVTVEEPRTITFGLIAWPVKPWPEEDFNLSNYIGTPRPEPPDYYEWDQGVAIAKEYGLNLVEWFHWNALDRIPDYPEFYNEEIRERVVRAAEASNRQGVPILGHTGFALPTDTEDFEYYGMEMVARPLVSRGRYGYAFTATPAYIDAYVGRYKKIAEETGWSGLQSDGGLNPVYSENLEAGFGWYDNDGELRGSYPIFAYRELARRLYNVFHGEVSFPDLPNGFGHITNHTYFPLGAVHSFVDSLHTGESRRSWGSFITFDRETERSIYPGRALGVPLLCLPKLDKVEHGGRGRIAFALAYNMNPLHNRILNHINNADYRKASYPAHLVWEARAWIGAHPDIYHGYWESQHLVSFDQEEFLGTLYLRPGEKALLGVINWLPEDRTVEATLNLREIGIPSGRLVLEDAITGERIEAPGGRMRLDVGGDGYRLLRLYAEGGS